MKLNVGSGQYPLPGYTNIDQYWLADISADFRDLEFSDVEEIVASHVLEHLPWRETKAALELLAGWLAINGRLIVEVPDMEAMAGREFWAQGVYGEQSHEGEFHKSGFTAASLRSEIEDVGLKVLATRRFLSKHPARLGFPCIEVRACRASPS